MERDPLPVDHPYVRFALEAFYGPQDRRNLAERQSTDT